MPDGAAARLPSLSELVDLPPLERRADPGPPRPAPAAGFAVTVRKRETRVFEAASEPIESAPKGPPPVFSAGPAQAPPPAALGAAAGDAGWSLLAFRDGSLQGTRTGHVLRARFATRSDLPPLRLSLETPPRGEDPVELRAVDLSIDAPGAFETLDLACRYELHDSHGRDLTLGRFPRTEEVAVLGESALPKARTGRDERILVSMAIDPLVREEARRLVGPDGFPPRDLVLRFAVDAVSLDGTRTTSGTRLVLVSLATAAAPTSDL